ncbi:MAG TPA: MATE family efflux transporter, partial [Clostridia bacterium]|nr:MATE family efflux transporter [Clostridia bacterium]
MSIGFSVVLSILILIFGPAFMGIFVEKAEAEVIRQGTQYIRIVSMFYFLMSINFITNGVLRGSGDINMSMLSTLLNLGGRVAAAYILAFVLSVGIGSIWWSLPIGWTAGMVICVSRYLHGGWKKKAIVQKEPVQCIISEGS